jgi:UrcA family protein
MEPNTMKSTLPALIVAAAALVTAIPSATFARENVTTERVPYADLNLASRAGIETLDRRLERAVKRVCGGDARHMGLHDEIAECREKARAGILPQREYAIARATGRQDGQAWAENSSRGSVVTLSE